MSAYLPADEKDNISIYDLSRRDPHASVVHGARRAQASQMPACADAPMRVGIHTARNHVLCMEVTSEHSHLFLGLADGTVETYDLDRFHVSPYRIPNLWWNEEEILRRSNVPQAPSRLHIPLMIDIQTHPRDCNILLLCYEGGAVLYSLRDSHAMSTYQLRLLPGAPGPHADAPMEEIWSERMCPATSIAWSPCGEMFAMGHENGALSIWSIKDEDKPLLVRTLDEIDIDRPVAPEDLSTQSMGPREPIFKLTWSGFPAQGWYEYGAQAASAWTGSGAAPTEPTSSNAASSSTPTSESASSRGTILTVMGGTPVRQSAACLYAFHLPPPPAAGLFSTSSNYEAQAKAKAAQRAALMPTHTTVYRTTGTVEDYCLLPRLNPHYRGTFDPYGILVLVGPDGSLPTIAAQSTQRGIEAYTFPPRRSEPAYDRLGLPLPLQLAGRGTVLGCTVATVPLAQYRRWVQAAPVGAIGSIKPDEFMGGWATPNLQGGATLAHAPAFARQGQPRLLVTWHLDGTVRMHDVSPHLLLLGESDPRRGVLLHEPFPVPLPHLTLSVRDMIMHPTMIGMPALEPLQRFPMQMQIEHVQVAWDAMECIVSLTTGHVVHLTMGTGVLAGQMHALALSDKTEGPSASIGLSDGESANGPLPEFTSMETICDFASAGFQPHTVLHVLPGPATCHALSDTGLYAAANGGMLVVADCRSQDIVIRSGFGHADFFSRQIGAREAKIIEAEAQSEIAWLTFAVCRTRSDPVLALRLLVGRVNGYVTVWTFERSSLEQWMGFRSDAVSLALPTHARIVHAQVVGVAGNVASTNEASVQRAAMEQTSPDTAESMRDFYMLLVATTQGAVLMDQVTGSRISHVEWPDPVHSAHIVEKQGAKTLVAVASNSIFASSLPRFDTTHRVQRHVPPSQEVVTTAPQVCIEDQGFFFEVASGHQLRVWSTFASLPHAERPTVHLFTPRSLPLAPGAGAGGYIASVAGWLGTSAGQSLSQAAQTDAVLAGSRRPAAPTLPPRMTWEKQSVPDPPANASGPPSSSSTPRGSVSGAAGAPSSAWALPSLPSLSGTRSSVSTPPVPPPADPEAAANGWWFEGYTKQLANFTNNSVRSQAHVNMQLLHKRDELLATLDEGMTSLERGAKDFFKQYVLSHTNAPQNTQCRPQSRCERQT